MDRVGTALVVASSPSAWEVVGGLPLAVRAARALQAAGVREVLLFTGAADRGGGRLAGRLDGATIHRLAGPAAVTSLTADPVLVVAGDVLFDAVALAPMARGARPGSVTTGVAPAAPGPVVAAMCPRALLATLLVALDADNTALGDALERAGAGPGERVALADGLCLPLDVAHPAARLERVLLDDLARRTTARDSYLAALIDRRLARPVTRLALRLPFTPAHITMLSALVGLAGAAGLATVSHWGRVLGALGLVVSVVLDCVDGEVARARLQQSAAGARLDLLGDYVVHLAVFLGLGIGLARQGLSPAGIRAVVLLIAGVVAAMAVMHVLFIRPALARGGDLHWAGDAGSLRGRVATLAERLASRDYTYVLLLLALAGRLDWFVYAGAAGAWAFVLGLTGYWACRRARWARPAASG
jgi:phosphatidylglycerophosphate synthase